MKYCWETASIVIHFVCHIQMSILWQLRGIIQYMPDNYLTADVRSHVNQQWFSNMTSDWLMGQLPANLKPALKIHLIKCNKCKQNCFLFCFVLFLAATKQLYEWYFLSVCPSVRPSVRLSHLFDYVPIIVSSWNFQKLSHWTRVRSMQKVKVRGQRSRSQRSRPKFSFPDSNSSLNSHMMIKLYI